MLSLSLYVSYEKLTPPPHQEDVLQPCLFNNTHTHHKPHTPLIMTKPSIKMAQTESSLKVSGKTFPIKDTIKTLGGRWEPSTKTWVISVSSATVDTIKETLLSAAAAAAEAALDDAVMTVPKALIKKAAGEKQWNWICCDKCRVVSWVHKHTTCSVHASHDKTGYGSDFSVRGFLYYGD